MHSNKKKSENKIKSSRENLLISIFINFMITVYRI